MIDLLMGEADPIRVVERGDALKRSDETNLVIEQGIAIGGKKLMEEVEAELQELSHRIFLNGGTHVDVVAVARRKAERAKAEQRAKDALAEIDSIGVQVKDLDIGLLDFPCEVDGRTVLLCWKLGEASITHWHGTDEGFAGRKPVDERIAKAKRTH